MYPMIDNILSFIIATKAKFLKEKKNNVNEDKNNDNKNNVNKKYNILKSNNSFLYLQKSMKKNISFNNFGTENNSITLPHIKNPNLSSQNIISFNGISNVNNDKPIKIRKKIISNINLVKK